MSKCWLLASPSKQNKTRQNQLPWNVLVRCCGKFDISVNHDHGTIIARAPLEQRPTMSKSDVVTKPIERKIIWKCNDRNKRNEEASGIDTMSFDPPVVNVLWLLHSVDHQSPTYQKCRWPPLRKPCGRQSSSISHSRSARKGSSQGFYNCNWCLLQRQDKLFNIPCGTIPNILESVFNVPNLPVRWAIGSASSYVGGCSRRRRRSSHWILWAWRLYTQRWNPPCTETLSLT